ncbi:MAG: phosphatase PAP2/dual specificity phosphatase family protein [Prosthecobacter sp.]|nr:phosphatase PAP2/dual specificity phosphatase family protein [Prosthecobacter sp.]
MNSEIERQSSRRPPWWQAALVSAVTGLSFLVIYNGCNWITKLRPAVQTAAFGWETMIPVVPWMIVPYWSLDAFFVVAPFLCRNKADLRLLARRLVLANVLCGLCFLIIPLELAWARPKVEGMFAGWFAAIQGMDAPHNLFPSLHIVLRTVLAVHYARHSRGVARFLSHVWFSLIGISTLLTWQHHLVDVLGGFLLAAVIFHITPGTAVKAETNKRLGVYYAAAAVLLLFCARLAPPWSLLLAWPAAALGTVAAAYFGAGAAVLGKRQGQLSFWTRWLLAPWLFGQWLSWKHYRKQSAPWDELTPRVWMGALPDEATARRLLAGGVTHVLDLTVEFEAPKAFRELPGYRNVAVSDLTAPTREQLAEAVEFIEGGQHEGIVFVHCKAGYSRTAAAAGAWLMLCQGLSTDEAIRRMREARPGMIIRHEVAGALTALEQDVATSIQPPLRTPAV